MADRQITQEIIEVDIESTSGEHRVTQVVIEVDIDSPTTGRTYGPAAAQM